MPPPTDPAADQWAAVAAKLGGSADQWAAAAAKLGAAVDQLGAGAAVAALTGATPSPGPIPFAWPLSPKPKRGSKAGPVWPWGGGGKATTPPKPSGGLAAAMAAGWAQKGPGSGSLVAAMRASMGGKPLTVPKAVSGGLAAAMANLAQKTPPPPPSPPGSTRFGRVRGLKRMFGALAQTFPGSPFAKASARAGRLKGIGKGLQAAGAGAKAAGLGRLATGLGGAGALAGRGAAIAGGPVGIAVAAVVTLGEMAVKAGVAIHGMTEETLRAQEQFAQASGGMAAVLGEKKVRDMLRDQRAGELQAGSARELARAHGNMRDELQRIETFISVAKAKILTPLEDFLAGLLHGPARDLEIIRWLIDGKAAPAEAPADIFKRIADQAEAARARRDAAFTRPDVTRHRP